MGTCQRIFKDTGLYASQVVQLTTAAAQIRNTVPPSTAPNGSMLGTTHPYNMSMPPTQFSFCKKERPYAMLPIQTHTNIRALSPTLINHVFQSSGVLLYLLVVMPVMLYLLNRCIISESRGSCLSLTLKVLHAWPQM